MKIRNLHTRMLRALGLALLSATFVVGCSSSDGKNGADGTAGYPAHPVTRASIAGTSTRTA